MQIHTARHAADLLRARCAGASGEVLLVVFLSEAREVLGVLERPGSADRVQLPLRRIAAEALRLKARLMIMAHHHPSGETTPSAADRVATRQLAELAVSLGIRLDDHLIFGGGGCTSLRAMGLL